MKTRFENWHKNKIVIVQLDQKGPFGMTVKVAAKVSLAGMNTNNLYFYSYDETTHKV